MRTVAALLLAACIAEAGITGRVIDARGGEPLARVRVQLAGTQFAANTDSDGVFGIDNVPPGEYVLHVETVGYRLLRRQFTLAAAEEQRFEVVLSPDTFRRTDAVEVSAGPFEVAAEPGVPELSLSGNEVKNLGTVLLDDPLRAVAVLPGVAANDDFMAQFTIRGAAFERVGLYYDDLLVHAPFHSIETDESTGSLAMLNGEMVQDMALLPAAFPARFGDRTAAALDVRSRDGSRSKPSIRIGAGVAAATVLAEGPISGGRGSWIASARKSYLQYLVSRATTDSSILVGFTDAQAKLTWDLTRANRVYMQVLDGTTDLDREAARARSGLNAIITGSNRTSIVRSGWRYSHSEKLSAGASAAWLRERYDSANRDDRLLMAGNYGEWVGLASLTAAWSPGNILEAGWTLRRLRDLGEENRFFTNAPPNQVDAHRGTARRSGAYLQQSWSAAQGKLRGSAGARIDTHSDYSGATVSPVASLAMRITHGTEWQLAAGQYVQYPELSLLTSRFGGIRLLPERATHFSTAIEHRIGENARVRLEAWSRNDRDLLARPFFDPRLSGGRILAPYELSVFNSVRGYSRGAQIMVQRRSANRLSGWIGYTYSRAMERDGLEGMAFPSSQDQRHIGSVFLSYRWTASLNLSSRYSYASGEPLPGYLVQQGNTYFVGSSRNQVRQDPYSRLDLRANKSFTWDRWKLTVYGELINATNRRNRRLVSYDGVNTRTGQAYLTIDRVFPILPAGGITLEF